MRELTIKDQLQIAEMRLNEEVEKNNRAARLLKEATRGQAYWRGQTTKAHAEAVQ